MGCPCPLKYFCIRGNLGQLAPKIPSAPTLLPLTMGSQDLFTGAVSQPCALGSGTQKTYWGFPDVARYPEMSQGKHDASCQSQDTPT